MDSQFIEWAKKKFTELKDIDDPDKTAMSMIKGIMESEISGDVKLSRIKSVISALEDT